MPADRMLTDTDVSTNRSAFIFIYLFILRRTCQQTEC